MPFFTLTPLFFGYQNKQFKFLRQFSNFEDCENFIQHIDPSFCWAISDGWIGGAGF